MSPTDSSAGIGDNEAEPGEYAARRDGTPCTSWGRSWRSAQNASRGSASLRRCPSSAKPSFGFNGTVLTPATAFPIIAAAVERSGCARRHTISRRDARASEQRDVLQRRRCELRVSPGRLIHEQGRSGVSARQTGKDIGHERSDIIGRFHCPADGPRGSHAGTGTGTGTGTDTGTGTGTGVPGTAERDAGFRRTARLAIVVGCTRGSTTQASPRRSRQSEVVAP